MNLFQKKPREVTNRARDMRHNPTPAEKILWAVLRNRQVEGCKFVRQYPISPFIVDFCCREKKLVIEVDGGIHLSQQPYDRMRDSDLTDLGYRVIRFTNEDVRKNMNSVFSAIQEALNH